MKVFLGPYEDDGERQIEVTIDDYDTWSMDHTLALIVEPMLRQIERTKHGSPYVDPDDVPEKLKPTTCPNDDNGWVDDTHHERWDWVLGEMIFAFASLNNDWEEQFYDDSSPSLEIKTVGVGPAQLRLFPDEDGSTEDYQLYEWLPSERVSKLDMEGRTEYAKRMENGFRMFGKYFQALWD